jgi:hypothetical protein
MQSNLAIAKMQLVGAKFHIATYIREAIFVTPLPNTKEVNMTKFTSALFTTVALMLTVSPALAAERNDRLFDAEGASVAKISRVAADGDVLVIYKGKIRRIQAETLTDSDGKLTTSMTRKEIRRLD